MIHLKQKPCSGSGRAKGYTGCGTGTIIRKEGLCPKCYKEWLINSPEGKAYVSKITMKARNSIKSANNREKKEQKHNFQSPHERFYKSQAWKYCSRYVLLYYADQDGYVKCCTSGLEYKVNDANMHCGHFIKVFDSNSTNYSTAFEFKNLGPQCSRDNTKLGGRPEVMSKWIDHMHGEGTSKWLEQEKHKAYKLDLTELEYWAKHYRELFNELVKEKGNPWKR